MAKAAAAPSQDPAPADLLEEPLITAKSTEDVAPTPEAAWTGQDAAVSKIERAMQTPAKGAPAEIPPKVRAILARALRAYKRQDFGTTALQAVEAARLAPSCAMAWHVLALGLENLGQLSKALVMYERALKLDPNDADIYLNLGLVAWRLRMLEGAERLFRICVQLRPDSPMGHNNLGGVLRDQGRFDDAVDTLRNAIYRFPDVAELWNSLGTCAMEQGLVPEARLFYEEALRIDPKFARAHHNIAYALTHTGDLDDSVRHYDQAISLTSATLDMIEIRHGRALSLLSLGRLAEGWREWDVRTDTRFRGAILYAVDAPRWKGESLEGKRLLVMGEQGLGDEIMFASGYRELISQLGPEGKLVIACDNRLVPLFARSFHGADLRLYSNSRHNGKLLRVLPWASSEPRFDYFSPNGSTLEFLRPSLQTFPTETPLLVADPDRVAYWRAKLAALSPKPKVGLCWRSMVMTGARAKYFSPLELWGPVLNNRDVTFINLQYGDSAGDRAFAAEHFGVDIHHFDELDLKNALDDNAALCKALDLVISAPTAAGAIAGSVGTKVWLITIGYVWPMLGAPDRFPWFINNQVMMPDTYADWPGLMTKLGAALDAFGRSPS